MMYGYRRALSCCVLVLISGSVAAFAIAADTPTPTYVTATVQSSMRTRPQIRRDADRKPADVLTFARIKPGAKVAMLAPDDYYVRLLCRLVGFQGKVYAMEPIHGIPGGGAINSLVAEAQKARQAGSPAPVNYAAYSQVLPLQHTTDFRNLTFMYGDLMFNHGSFPVPEQLDAVFTSQSYHQLHSKVDGPANNAPLDMVGVNKAIFRTMKPGGVYIVSDYAASSGAGFSQTQELNRSEADAVKQEVLAAGFVFDGESKVLANPSDDRNSPASGDKADQFILRFKKPANASPTTKRLPLSVMKNYYGNSYATGYVPGPPEAISITEFFHADPQGGYEESMASIGETLELERQYFDADGFNCAYHEIPQESFVTCHNFFEEWVKAKPGDVWKGPGAGGGGSFALLKGLQYPIAPPNANGGRRGGGGEEGGAQPAKQPDKQPGKAGRGRGGEQGGGADSGGM